jgi:hypothetical protein
VPREARTSSAFSAQSRQIREMTIRQSARANWPSLL